MAPAAARNGNVLVVDHETSTRETLRDSLVACGFRAIEAADAVGALDALDRVRADAALIDLFSPGQDGMELIEKLKGKDPHLEIVILADAGATEKAVEAVRRGAFHFIYRPVKLPELESLTARAVEKARLSRQNAALTAGLRNCRGARTCEIVARSSAMKAVLREAEIAARLDYTVLLQGETGAGKEVVARHIHEIGSRRDRPWMVLNCAALSETLVDADLFGYEKGAFTGAEETRPGLLEASEGGTLLLDEIGDIPPLAQTRLLRFLETGLFRKVGSVREQHVDVRVLAATNKDLEAQVRAGRFREDLFHRLYVVGLRIPPLRDRREDVLPLAEHFLARSMEGRAQALALSEDSREALVAYSWPGNVRELAHAIERAGFVAILNGSSTIEPAHLRLSLGHRRPTATVSLEEAERRHVLAVVERLGDDRDRAASALGISKRHLYRLLDKYRGSERA